MVIITRTNHIKELLWQFQLTRHFYKSFFQAVCVRDRGEDWVQVQGEIFYSPGTIVIFKVLMIHAKTQTLFSPTLMHAYILRRAL